MGARAELRNGVVRRGFLQLPNPERPHSPPQGSLSGSDSLPRLHSFSHSQASESCSFLFSTPQWPPQPLPTEGFSPTLQGTQAQAEGLVVLWNMPGLSVCIPTMCFLSPSGGFLLSSVSLRQALPSCLHALVPDPFLQEALLP